MAPHGHRCVGYAEAGPSVPGGSRPSCWSTFTPSAALALERFWALMDRWRDSVAAMTAEQLDMVGFGQYPNGSDPEVPFITIVWWTNLEFIHHMGRDRPAPRPVADPLHKPPISSEKPPCAAQLHVNPRMLTRVTRQVSLGTDQLPPSSRPERANIGLHGTLTTATIDT